MLNTCIDAYKLFRYWTLKTHLNCLIFCRYIVRVSVRKSLKFYHSASVST